MMNRKKFTFIFFISAIICLLNISISISFASTYNFNRMSHQEVTALEQALDLRIKENLKTYLGIDVRYSLFINLLSTALPKEAVNAQSNSVDMGYLYVPGVSQNMVSAEFYKVKGAKINLFIYDKVKEQTLDNLKALSLNVIPELPLDVKFTLLTEPPLVEAPKQPPKPVEVKPPKTFKDYVTENMPALFKFLGTIGTAIMALIGFLIFSFVLRDGVAAIANSIQSAKLHLKEEHASADPKKATTDKLGEKNGIDAVTDSTSKQKIEVGTAKSNPEDEFSISAKFHDKLSMIRKTIKDRPQALLKSVSDQSRDLKGLKRLIPLLVEDERKILKDSLNDEILSQMERETSTPLSEMEFQSWVSEFVEKLILNSLKKGNYFTTILEDKFVNILSNTDTETLLQAAKKTKGSLALKIILDFLSPSITKKIMASISMDQWSHILNDKIPALEEINQQAQEIVRTIEFLKANPGENNDMHLNKVIMPPIVNFISDKDLGEDDKFIDQIAAISPAFAKRVREQVWTPKILLQVPRVYLANMVRDLEPDDKVLLAIGLPLDISNLMLSFIPDGKSKAIIEDQVKRLRAKANPEKEQQAKELCRIFIAQLRDDEKSGKFRLETSEVATTKTETAQTTTDQTGNLTAIKKKVVQKIKKAA